MENIGPIRNKNDLWAAIIACHSSEDFQLWNPTFSEFAQLHVDSNYQPILLIDTLDFLAYGIDKDELPHVVTAWKELTTHMEQTNMKVLWTCRTEEANLFDVGNTDIVKIRLPKLDRTQCEAQASKLLENPNFDKSLSRSPNLLEPVWVVMLMNFPIINIYMRKQDDHPSSSINLWPKDSQRSRKTQHWNRRHAGKSSGLGDEPIGQHAADGCHV